ADESGDGACLAGWQRPAKSPAIRVRRTGPRLLLQRDTEIPLDFRESGCIEALPLIVNEARFRATRLYRRAAGVADLHPYLKQVALIDGRRADLARDDLKVPRYCRRRLH